MKIYKYLGIAALMTFSLSSCSDFLDPDNKSTANDDADKYLTAHPEALKPVAFDAFKFFATHLELNEEATDLYFVTSAADGYGDFTMTAEDKTVTDYYANAYKAINYANGMVHYGGADSKLGHEGRFLRALGYYHLLQQFGGVPYITHYIQDSNRSYPRNTAEEVYEALVKDLKEIYNGSQLPATDHTGQVSKQAVAALLAKTLLAEAWDLDVDAVNPAAGTYNVKSRARFAEAAEWAEKAINGVQLTMSFDQKWSPKNEGNAEEIFSVQYDRAGYPGDVASGGHSLQNQYMSYYGNVVTIGQKGCSNGGKYRMSYKAMRLFEPGDERWEGTFMTEYWNAPIDASKNALWGTEGYFAYYNCTPAELAKKNLAFKFYPAYMTEAEVRADLQSKYAGRTHSFGEGYSILNQVARAVILDYPQVTKIQFNLDGSLGSAEYQNTRDFISPAYGGVCVRKYDDPESDQVTGNNDYRDIPVFHVSDMYLVAAEAYLMAGDEGKALAKVNDVRNRAKAGALSSFGSYYANYNGITNVPFTINALDVILDERARECYAERTRFEDLRRTKQFIRYNLAFSRVITNENQMKGPDGQFKILRPIPQTAFSLNIGLKPSDQNPGYGVIASSGEETTPETPAN